MPNQPSRTAEQPPEKLISAKSLSTKSPNLTDREKCGLDAVDMRQVSPASKSVAHAFQLKMSYFRPSKKEIA
jgi:hypothetical protein